MAEKAFGHIAGVTVGTVFASRKELAEARVHPPLMQGIHGTKAEGADSIVVSGGYVDDQDFGDVIIYTGAGSNDPNTGRQVADQSIDHPNNAGLVTSELSGLPVRVTRGAHRASPHSPGKGFRYDGLFAVASHWIDVGRDGFKIVRFRLEKLDDEAPSMGPEPRSQEPQYSTTAVTRRIRDSRAARRVKELHGHRCQVCSEVLLIDGGRPYAEGAHIRPLGAPDLGSDHESNLLCLCPNHHTLLDYGGLTITPNLQVFDRLSGQRLGSLRTVTGHEIDVENLTYRLEHIQGNG